MTPRAKAALLFVGVFVLGAAAGAGVSRVYVLRELRPTMDAPLGEARAHFRLQAMKRHLDLSSDQLARLETIVRNAETERERHLAACQPAMDELRERTDAQILEILRPDQRDRYRDLASRRGPPGRPGPGRAPGPPP